MDNNEKINNDSSNFDQDSLVNTNNTKKIKKNLSYFIENIQNNPNQDTNNYPLPNTNYNVNQIKNQLFYTAQPNINNSPHSRNAIAFMNLTSNNNNRVDIDNYNNEPINTLPTIEAVYDAIGRNNFSFNEETVLAELSNNDDNRGYVRRPMNAFMVWSKHARKKIAMAYPNLLNCEISKLLGREWSRMTITDKEPFVKLATKLRENHNILHPDYTYKPRKRRKKESGQKNQAIKSFNDVDTTFDDKLNAIARGYSNQHGLMSYQKPNMVFYMNNPRFINPEQLIPAFNMSSQHQMGHQQQMQPQLQLQMQHQQMQHQLQQQMQNQPQLQPSSISSLQFGQNFQQPKFFNPMLLNLNQQNLPNKQKEIEDSKNLPPVEINDSSGYINPNQAICKTEDTALAQQNPSNNLLNDYTKNLMFSSQLGSYANLIIPQNLLDNRPNTPTGNYNTNVNDQHYKENLETLDKNELTTFDINSLNEFLNTLPNINDNPNEDPANRKK